jgi:hypothetical protein
MNCTKCGQPVSDTAHFCPGCGTPVGGGPSRPTTGGRLIAILGGAVALLLIAAAAVWFIKRPQPSGSAAALQAQPAAPDSPKIAPAQIGGFDWSGLSPEQLQSARAALDEAIAKEERARAGASNPAPADGKNTP